jgi:integrase
MMTSTPRANVLATVTGRGASRSCWRRAGQDHGRSAVQGCVEIHFPRRDRLIPPLSAVRNLVKIRTVDFARGRISMTKTHLRLVAPTEVNRTVPPKRRKNVELRTREHLTPDEVEELIEAAKGNRYGHRDATMILLAFRHGLRAAEVCDLRWDQVDLKGGVLHVRRVKNGTRSTHPVQGTSCARYGGCSARAHPLRSSSSASGARPSPRPASPG